MDWGEAVGPHVALKVLYGCISFGCIFFLGRSGLNNRKLLSHSSGVSNSKIKVLAELVLSAGEGKSVPCPSSRRGDLLTIFDVSSLTCVSPQSLS